MEGSCDDNPLTKLWMNLGFSSMLQIRIFERFQMAGIAVGTVIGSGVEAEHIFYFELDEIQAESFRPALGCRYENLFPTILDKREFPIQ